MRNVTRVLRAVVSSSAPPSPTPTACRRLPALYPPAPRRQVRAPGKQTGGSAPYRGIPSCPGRNRPVPASRGASICPPARGGPEWLATRRRGLSAACRLHVRERTNAHHSLEGVAVERQRGRQIRLEGISVNTAGHGELEQLGRDVHRGDVAAETGRCESNSAQADARAEVEHTSCRIRARLNKLSNL
eukprot:scaffold12001_cov116-Isochrysis_galbana.AAC.4